MIFILGIALIVAFLPVINSQHSTAVNPSVNTDANFSAGSACNGAQNICSTAALSVSSGDTIMVAYSQTGVLVGSNVLQNFIRINDSQSNSITQIISSYYSNEYSYGETIIFRATAGATGTDTITLTTWGGVESTTAFDVINSGGSTFTTGSNYSGFVPNIPFGLDIVSYAGAYSGSDCPGPTVLGGVTTQHSCSGGSFFGFAVGYIGASTNSTVSILNSGNERQAMSVVNIGSGGGCFGCVVTTGTTTFPTTYTTVIGGTTVVDGTQTINGTTYTIPAGSTTTIGGTTFIRSGNTTETYTSTLGSTFVTTITSITSTTATQTVLNAPSPDSFSFWAIPLMFNMIFAMLFIAIPAALKVSSGYLYGLLFFSGLTMGGMFGLLAHVTPWEDPLFCGVITGAILATRILS